jgi:DNA-binding CsgD family transcriptional regulator
MSTRRQRVGVLLCLVALVLVAGWRLRGVGSAATSAAVEPAGKGQYVDALIAHFAAQLGVDEPRLNSAFTAAVGDTVDEAIRNGTLDEKQAADVRKVAHDGLRGILSMSVAGDLKRMDGATRAPVSIEAAAASALGITEDQLKQELATGKSFSELALAHKIDPQQFQTALLNNCKAQLDSAVQRGVLTQTQADELYRNLTLKLTALLTEKPDAAPPKEEK